MVNCLLRHSWRGSDCLSPRAALGCLVDWGQHRHPQHGYLIEKKPEKKKKKTCYCVIPTTLANSIPVLEHQPTQMAAVIASGLLSVAFCVCRGRRRRREKRVCHRSMINGHGEENWTRKWGMEIALDGRLDKQGEWNGWMDGWTGGQTKSNGWTARGWLAACFMGIFV